MGVCILGCKIIKRSHKNNDDLSSTYVLEGFERTLLDNETFDFNRDTDETVIADGIEMAYSNYNRLREYICRLLLDKEYDQMSEECNQLDKKEPYPNALCHLLNFADNEGYIGPTAVKALSAYLSQSLVKDKIDNFSNEIITDKHMRQKMNDLFDCIHQTAKEENGFIVLS